MLVFRCGGSEEVEVWMHRCWRRDSGKQSAERSKKGDSDWHLARASTAGQTIRVDSNTTDKWTAMSDG
jgi:hypothetical protein